MKDMHDRPDHNAQLEPAAPPPEDTRKPYEPPRLLKKRSVARATLFTAMGVMASGLTVMG